MNHDPLLPLEKWAAALLARMQPAQRRKLASGIGRELRRSNTARMRSGRGADGTPWQPRKPQTGLRSKKARLRAAANARRPLFAKMPAALKTNNSAAGSTLQFKGRRGRIAAVHQFGRRDSVNRYGTRYDYPARPLLGIHQTDKLKLRERIKQHLLA